MSGSTSPGSRTIHPALLAVNAAGVAASTVFSVVGLARPGHVRSGSSPDAPTRFWAASSAVRTWAVAAPLLVVIARGRRPEPQVLVVAGIVQLMDAGLGVRQRNLPMAVLPAATGLVHLASARILAAADVQAAARVSSVLLVHRVLGWRRRWWGAPEDASPLSGRVLRRRTWRWPRG